MQAQGSAGANLGGLQAPLLPKISIRSKEEKEKKRGRKRDEVEEEEESLRPPVRIRNRNDKTAGSDWELEEDSITVQENNALRQLLSFYQGQLNPTP